VNGQPTEWFSIEITAEPSAVEAIESLFNELGALGTEIQQFHKKEGEPLTVIGYFGDLPDEEQVHAELSQSLRVYGLTSQSIKSIERKTIEKTDWLAEWKKHWRPTRVGRFLVAPEWEILPDEGPNSIVIRIEPNMAFGTGTHETTQLCLKAIDERFAAGMNFLDVGTGTGILAIAAAKMRTTEVQDKILALDIDPDSITIARENALRNNVARHIEFRCGELASDTPAFDFVCVNLTLDVILPILPKLLEKSRKVLVLSGILVEQESQLIAELNHLCIKTVYIERRGEWIAAILCR
jgi:ribosomal protein L11 methyltransferase